MRADDWVGAGGDFRLPGDLFGTAREWVSVTPFVGPAHIGSRAKGRYLRKALGREARRWLGERGHDAAKVVITEVEPGAGGSGDLRPWEYRRARTRKPGDGYQRPCGFFRLTLPIEVERPMSLGYGGHFGMGLFRPLRDGAAR